jgi:hypothetical protein
MRGGRERERGKESGEGKWQMAVAMVDSNGGWWVVIVMVIIRGSGSGVEMVAARAKIKREEIKAG